jgi:hypothetical protein
MASFAEHDMLGRQRHGALADPLARARRLALLLVAIGLAGSSFGVTPRWSERRARIAGLNANPCRRRWMISRGFSSLEMGPVVARETYRRALRIIVIEQEQAG